MVQVSPRLLRPLPNPLGLYFRPGFADHKKLLALIAEGRTAFTGLVFEPSWSDRQDDLRREIQKRNLESVLDTRAMELATPGGHSETRAQLPWAIDG